MKWTSTLTATLLPATALSRFVAKRDDLTTTDTYLYSISLDQFVVYRNNLNPATLDWTSDGCSKSPDNPLGFDFEPACYRHDFGYNNYRAQSRFTESAKASIDSNFYSDLKSQCDEEWPLESVCDALAAVYYTAVKAFGGDDATPGKRADADAALVADYEAALATYNALVAEAEASGDLATALGTKETKAKMMAKRDAATSEAAVAEYKAALAAYDALVAAATANGDV